MFPRTTLSITWLHMVMGTGGAHPFRPTQAGATRGRSTRAGAGTGTNTTTKTGGTGAGFGAGPGPQGHLKISTALAHVQSGARAAQVLCLRCVEHAQRGPSTGQHQWGPSGWARSRTNWVGCTSKPSSNSPGQHQEGPRRAARACTTAGWPDNASLQNTISVQAAASRMSSAWVRVSV